MSEATSFTVELDLGNAAMRTAEDAADALRKIADKLEAGDTTSNIRDVNGNIVGEFRLRGGSYFAGSSAAEDAALEAARELGRDAGRNAASWTVDGNSDREERARVLAMLEDGDPAAWDYLPNVPNLSGEWADDPTPRSLTHELGLEDAEPEEEEAIADAWQEGVDETFQEECERLLREFVSD